MAVVPTYSGVVATALGNAITQRRFTITAADVKLLGAFLTGDVLLFTSSKGSKIVGVTIKASTAFTGNTTLTVSVGTGTGGTVDAFASAFDIMAAVSDTNFQDTDEFKSLHYAGDTISAHFIATVANLSSTATGVVDIFITYLDVTDQTLT